MTSTLERWVYMDSDEELTLEDIQDGAKEALCYIEDLEAHLAEIKQELLKVKPVVPVFVARKIENLVRGIE